MFRPLVNAVYASLVISIFVGAEAAAITSSEYLPLAGGNSSTYSVDGASTLTLTVVPGTTLNHNAMPIARIISSCSVTF